MERNIDLFWECVTESDMDFYKRFLVNLSDEELEKFFEDNPDFLRE